MRLLIVWCFTIAGAPVPVGPIRDRPVSLVEYIAELDRLLAVVEDPGGETRLASNLVNGIPARWVVRADDRMFTVPTQRLRGSLEAWREAPNRTSLSRVAKELRELRVDASEFQVPPVEVRRERATLDRILADPGFKGIHGPTWLDELTERLRRIFYRFLGRVLPTTGPPAIGIAILVLLAGVAALMIHRVRRTARIASLLDQGGGAAGSPLARQWETWLSEARAAAAGARWRDAIHLAYWCGISFLESQGIWTPDPALTPREYLRLLPASSDRRPALALLTRELERVWYGTGDADAEAFSRALSGLDHLGCPLT